MAHKSQPDDTKSCSRSQHRRQYGLMLLHTTWQYARHRTIDRQRTCFRAQFPVDHYIAAVCSDAAAATASVVWLMTLHADHQLMLVG